MKHFALWYEGDPDFVLLKGVGNSLDMLSWIKATHRFEKRSFHVITLSCWHTAVTALNIFIQMHALMLIPCVDTLFTNVLHYICEVIVGRSKPFNFILLRIGQNKLTTEYHFLCRLKSVITFENQPFGIRIILTRSMLRTWVFKEQYPSEPLNSHFCSVVDDSKFSYLHKARVLRWLWWKQQDDVDEVAIISTSQVLINADIPRTAGYIGVTQAVFWSL